MRVSRLHIISYCILFFLVLFSPTIKSYFISTSTVNCEKRSLKAFPKLTWNDSILQELGAYYEEHFGLRNEFIYWQSELKVAVFNSSSNPKDVQIGRANWLFPTSKLDYSYGSYTHRDLWSTQELITVRKIHLERKNLLKNRNCTYLLAVWPNKTTIYPEFIPKHLHWMKKDTLSKVDQLIQFFKESNIDIPIIYPKNYLLKHKKEKLYFKNDTHWNQLGAFYGYVYFMNQTSSLFGEKPKNRKAYKISYKSIKSGDLLKIMGMCSSNLFPEKIPQLKCRKYVKIYATPNDISYKHINPSATSNKKVLFFRDSYTRNLLPYFTQHFKESYYYWQDYDQKIVDSLRPDVVVVSKVERYF